MDTENRETVIAVQALRMTYGQFEAVRGVDFTVSRGEVFAVLGPNGAGKTTTMEILEGFRRRTSGAVSVLGQDPATADEAWRARLGIVLQDSQPEPELSVRECLALYAGYYPAPRPIDETLALVGLNEKGSTLCGRLSGGQRRRLDVALALIGDPELIFLDEPTTGFDPAARRAAWEVVAGLRTLGKTIVLTTHYMDEAEALADRLVVVAAGRIVAEGTPRTLGGRAAATAAIRFSLPPAVAPGDLPGAEMPLTVTQEDSRVEVRLNHPLPYLGTLAAWAAARGLDLADLTVQRPTLEEIYLQLTNGGVL